MKHPARIPALLIVLWSLAACAGQAANVSPVDGQGELAFPGAVPPEGGFAEESAARSADASVFTSAIPSAERLVIRTASLTLVVEDPSISAEAIQAMAEEMGGFVVSSNLYQTSFGDPAVLATQASVTIRVPADRFPEALRRLKEDAQEVRSENVTGEDVTQQYTDLQSRLRNLEAAEIQLREIMETATKVEDVLRVFEDLRRVREEIEITKGQIQYYAESASFSAISVELIPDVAAQPLQIGGWKPEGTAKQAIEVLVRSLQTLADAAIWLAICGVPAALLIGLGWVLVQMVRRRRASRSAPAAKP